MAPALPAFATEAAVPDVRSGLPCEPDACITIFPRDLELIPRDRATNQGRYVVGGSVDGLLVDRVKLEVFRDGSLEQTMFAFVAPIPEQQFWFQGGIDADLVTYDFVLSIRHAEGKVLEERARSERVVAGDVYVLNGQSNAVAASHVGGALELSSDFIRVFGRMYVGAGFEGLGGDDVWHVATTESKFADGFIGNLGMAFAHELVSTRSVPIALVNGAEGGEPIEHFYRNDADPEDLSTNYGRLLWRLKHGGLHSSVSALIWNHGEAQAHPYHAAFAALEEAWRIDLPGSFPIYAAQIGRSPEAGSGVELTAYRDSFRPMARPPGDGDGGVTVFSHNSVFDPLAPGGGHYSTIGYAEVAALLARMVTADVYGESGEPGIYSPDAIGVRCLRAARCRAANVMFDAHADFVPFTTVRDQHRLARFRLEGCSVQVAKVKFKSPRKLRLVLSEPLAASCTGLSYLGPLIAEAPFLENRGGAGALTFYDEPFRARAQRDLPAFQPT